MGVRGLTKLISSCGKLVPYSAYKNKYVIVDAFQKIYKYCTNLENIDEKKFNGHLRAIMNCVSTLTRFQIIPIFVFDGQPLAIKLKNKKEHKENNESLSETSETSEENINEQKVDKPKIKNVPFKISPKQIKECENLINYIGLPCVRAPYEADSQCAAMAMKYDDEIIMTDDTDVLVFGASSILRMIPYSIIGKLRRLFQNFLDTHPDSSKFYSIESIAQIMREGELIEDIKNKINVKESYPIETINLFGDREFIKFAIQYNMNDISEFLLQKANAVRKLYHKAELKIFSRNNFIDMCIAFGTDYLPRIINANVDEIFAKFALADFDIRKILEEYQIDSEKYLSDFRNVKEYYQRATIIDPETINNTLCKPSQSEIFTMLQTYHFTDSYIASILRTYNRTFNYFLTRENNHSYSD